MKWLPSSKSIFNFYIHSKYNTIHFESMTENKGTIFGNEILEKNMKIYQKDRIRISI